MNFPVPKTKFSDILEELGKTLDITKEQYDAAVSSYKYVGEWLSQEDSFLAKYSPEILPQGSFLLQTMIRPILEDDELDIDLVCKLEKLQLGLTQFGLKKMVGDRLKNNGKLEPLLKNPDGRRCWTLQYSESAKFHLDVLPSVVATGYKTILEKAISAIEIIEDTQSLGIRITDKETYNYHTSTNLQEWLKSNPFGYAIWFRNRAKTLNQRTIPLFEAVQPVPTYQTDKLPLQRVVQILKRHRDIMFEGDENKPISIIITTLAAKAYEGQVDIKDALIGIINRMELFIEEMYCEEHRKNIKWVGNPVYDKENFADKWVENNVKQENFYDWLYKVKEDFNHYGDWPLNETYMQLKSSLGTRSINEAFRNSGLTDIIKNSSAYPTAFSSSLLTVLHRQQPSWHIRLTNTVDIIGRFKHNGQWKSISPQTKVPKSCDVLFTATTNVSKPFDVYWQIVNTGHEAIGDLRGGIFHSKTFGVGGLSQKETTRYKGTHWIECFIVKNGICVARSSEFFVTVD